MAPLFYALVQLEYGLAVLNTPPFAAIHAARPSGQLGDIKSLEITYRHAVSVVAGRIAQTTGRSQRPPLEDGRVIEDANWA